MPVAAGHRAAKSLESASTVGPDTCLGIVETCRRFGISLRAIRHYEAFGLLSPRRQGQERLYSRRDRARLSYVVMGKNVGFSLDEIREMLDLYDLGDRQVTQLRVAQQKIADRVARLEAQRGDRDRAIAELTHARKLIEGMLTTRERSERR